MADVSGTAVLQTPEIQRLLVQLESKETGRRGVPGGFAPDAPGALCRVRPAPPRFQDNRKTLYLPPDSPVDFSTKQGMLVGSMRALVGRPQRSGDPGANWLTKEAMRRQGRSPNGSTCLPYGVLYDRVKAVWSYDPEKAPRIREVFRRFLAGDTNYNALWE